MTSSWVCPSRFYLLGNTTHINDFQQQSDDTMADAAAALTELEQARVGSRRRVVVSGGGKLAGAGTVRAQQVSDEVGAGGLPRRAEAGADPGARSHPEGVKQITYSCEITKRDEGGEKNQNTKTKRFQLFDEERRDPYASSPMWRR